MRTTKKELHAISEEIQKLIKLSKEPASLKVKAGKTIIKKGETGNFMYVVQEGAIDIVSDDIRLERVHPGGVIGEMTLVDEAVRSAAAVANMDSVLIPVGKTRFLHLIRVDPNFALYIMKTMIKRVRQMNVHLEMAKKSKRK